mgnify:CR=1 FL=1
MSKERVEQVEGAGAAVPMTDISNIDVPEGTDEHADEVYRKGTENLRKLIEDHALVADAEAHLYLYAQKMGEHRQIGVVGCASVAELTMRTGAGASCGSCLGLLAEMIEDVQAARRALPLPVLPRAA